MAILSHVIKMKKTWLPLFAVVIAICSFNFCCDAYANSGDFSGGVAIGSGYAGISAAPANGLIVQGGVGIGSTNPIASLDLSKNVDAVALPIGTTGNRPVGAALSNGEIRYNSSTPGVEAYVGGAWATLSGGGGVVVV
jgi:hypothetical protein